MTRRSAWWLLLSLLAVVTIASYADAYTFGASTTIRAQTTDDDSETDDPTSVTDTTTTTSKSTIKATAFSANSRAVTRPHTADEDVETALAELAANGTNANSHSSSTDTTPTPTKATTTKPKTTKPTTPTPTPTEQEPTPTPTPTPTNNTSGSRVSAQDLSTDANTEAARASMSGSLNKTVVIAIVGIVAAIAVTALLVSRHIKNMFDHESDDEL